jgi:hypothetical protein
MFFFYLGSATFADSKKIRGVTGVLRVLYTFTRSKTGGSMNFLPITSHIKSCTAATILSGRIQRNTRIFWKLDSFVSQSTMKVKKYIIIIYLSSGWVEVLCEAPKSHSTRPSIVSEFHRIQVQNSNTFTFIRKCDTLNGVSLASSSNSFHDFSVIQLGHWPEIRVLDASSSNISHS